MADKEESYVQVRCSHRLKEAFTAQCKEREISISDAIRDLMSTSVRNYSRKNVKGAEKEQ